MDKSAFRSRLESWGPNPLCLVAFTMEGASIRVWLNISGVGLDELAFGGRPGTEVTLDINDADSFTDVDVEIPAAIRAERGFNFSAAVRFRVRDGLWVSILRAKR